jgi:hypothetical protein
MRASLVETITDGKFADIVSRMGKAMVKRISDKDHLSAKI